MATSNPDVRPYVDLVLYDRTVQEIFDVAADDLAVKLPELELREGHTETVLLEAGALQVSELVFAVNRIPGAITEVLLRLFGVEPEEGSAPTATARFFFSDVAGHEIPAGAVELRLDLGGDVGVVTFTTTESALAGAPATEAVAAIVGDRATEIANGTAAGTELEVLDSIPYLERVELEIDVVAGVNPEAPEDFLDRGVQRLRRLVTTLVRPEHFTAYALEDPAVDRATTVDNHDPAVGASPGHVTVVAVGPGGVDLAAPDAAALEVELEAAAMAPLDVHITGATVTAVAVTATVVRQTGQDSAVVDAAVVAALEAYLNPETWPWAGTVYRNELIALISAVEGVERVVVLTAPAADANLGTTNARPAALADAGVIDITVNAP